MQGSGSREASSWEDMVLEEGTGGGHLPFIPLPFGGGSFAWESRSTLAFLWSERGGWGCSS